MNEIEEEMRKFTEGFAYKPRKYPYNYFRDCLKMMNGKATIIADDPQDQEIADQLTTIVNQYLQEEKH